MTVLVSSAGRRVALVDIFRRALREAGLPARVAAADASLTAAACVMADVSALVPPCLAPEFVPAMLELCGRLHVRLLVPTIDTELSVLADSKAAFSAAGTTVAISSPEAVKIASDKRRTHEFLRTNGLPTVDQVEISASGSLAAPWDYPFIVKPVSGSASHGVHVVSDAVALASAVQQGAVVAQRIAPGREYTVDVLVDADGEVLEAVPRERIEVRAGEVSKGRTARVPAIIKTAGAVAEALPGAFGVLTIQIFYDEATNETAVIEVNPRFGGGYPLAQRAGADFAGWLVRHAYGLPQVESLSWQEDMLMLRYDAAVFTEGDIQGTTGSL